MRGTDPAVEAAERASGTLRTSDMIRAAREALAPIKALHKPGGLCRCCSGSHKRPVCTCVDCVPDYPAYTHWPCETARLVYPSEEL